LIVPGEPFGNCKAQTLPSWAIGSIQIKHICSLMKPPDDYLEYAGTAKFEATELIHGIGKLALDGRFIGAGIANHRIDPSSEIDRHTLSALDLEVFSELDWRLECENVLRAHGWLNERRYLGRKLGHRMLAEKGRGFLLDLRRRHPENWQSHLFEIACIGHVKALTRLWYVCNMLALLDVHGDQLRLGFLWSEYQQRLRNERALATGTKVARAAPLGGKTRAQMHKVRNSNILAEMRRLLLEGHSKRRAAELVFEKGFGTSPDANRKIWSRQT
jgi:hypothetical protein